MDIEAKKAAARERVRLWNLANPLVPGSERHLRRLELRRARRAANPEKERAARKRQAGLRRDEKLAARRAKHAAMTPEEAARTKAAKALYRKRNAERIAAAKRAWDAANKERIKAYAEANRERFTARTMERYRTEPRFALNLRMSCLVRNTLKGRGGRKSARWEELVGYTIAALEKHLRRTMPDGHGWQEFLDGKLHIEHRIPLAAFNFTSPEHADFRRAWALSNLRLLPGPDNLKKRDKLDAPFQPSLAM